MVGLLRSPSQLPPVRGILTRCPSTTLSASPWGRLTLPRLTLDRNPWSSGVRVFHPHYRYLCQHSHFLIPPAYLWPPSQAYRTLLPNNIYSLCRFASWASVHNLARCILHLPAQADSTSELLRFL